MCLSRLGVRSISGFKRALIRQRRLLLQLLLRFQGFRFGGFGLGAGRVRLRSIEVGLSSRRVRRGFLS